MRGRRRGPQRLQDQGAWVAGERARFAWGGRRCTSNPIRENKPATAPQCSKSRHRWLFKMGPEGQCVGPARRCVVICRATTAGVAERQPRAPTAPPPPSFIRAECLTRHTHHPGCWQGSVPWKALAPEADEGLPRAGAVDALSASLSELSAAGLRRQQHRRHA